MAGRIVHCGGDGAGQAAKLCNNMILGISMIGVAEAFVLAEKLGLSHQALFDVASTSSGQCWSLTTYCPVPGPVPTSPANRDYKPGFAAALMLKDLKLAQEAALESGAVTPARCRGSTALCTVQRSGKRRRRLFRHCQFPARHYIIAF
jgi:3-hydroxyisobutyrate dehydrogenase